MPNSLFYFAFVDELSSPGVANKVSNTVKAAQEVGFTAEEKFYQPKLSSAVRFILDVFLMKPNVAMIRFSRSLFPLLFLPLLIMRLRGVKIIVDVPTPRAVVLKEFKSNIKSPLKRFIVQTISILSGSWVLMPAHLIVQYADESNWFSFGVRNKTIKIGNGIFIDERLPISKACWSQKDTLQIIGVAQLADWHGYDRVIKALAKVKNVDVHFTIVGDGDAKHQLEGLVNTLELSEKVTFTGMLSGNDLNNVYANAHVGVSSLGLYRKGLSEASDLKTREYLSRGLCVIGAGKDPDFTDSSCADFRFTVPNDSSVEPLISLIESFGQVNFPSKESCREFAEQRLSLQKKLKIINSYL